GPPYRCRSGPPRARRPCRPPIAGCPGGGCPDVCCWSSGAPSFAFSPGYLGVQGVQPLFPQGPVAAQPFIDLGERLRAEAVDPPLRLLADLDQSSFPQHPQVSRYPRRGDRQQRRQLAGGGRATSQGVQHGPPALVRQCPQDSFHSVNVPRWLRNRQGTCFDGRAHISALNREPARESGLPDVPGRSENHWVLRSVTDVRSTSSPGPTLVVAETVAPFPAGHEGRSSRIRSISRPSWNLPSPPRSYLRIVPTGRKPTF